MSDASADVELPLTGGCNCGAVRFEIDEPLVSAVYCHCTRCQRRTGSGAAATGSVAEGSMRVVRGEDELRGWKPQDGWEKVFCGACGSALFTRDPEDGRIRGVRLGTFDGDPGVRPRAHQFVAYAAPWEAIPDDGLPRFPEKAAR
jgi:hypothetical protein